MGRIGDRTAEMRPAGLTFDDHMLYTIVALHAEYEAEARNLASRDSIGRDDIINVVQERRQRLSRNRNERFNARHAGHAMFADGGSGGRRKGCAGGFHGNGGGRGEIKGEGRGQQGRGWRCTNEDGGGSSVASGGDGSSTKAAEAGKFEVRCYRCGTKGHRRVDDTEELCSPCHGRRHAATVCTTLKEEAVLGASDDDDDDDTVEISAFEDGESGEYSDGLGKKGEGKFTCQTGDEI